jgi:hypothetical protein
MHASQARSRILGTSHRNCQRDALFFRRAGFIQILSSGKSGTPPCKSRQLEKDLGLEAISQTYCAANNFRDLGVTSPLNSLPLPDPTHAVWIGSDIFPI